MATTTTDAEGRPGTRPSGRRGRADRTGATGLHVIVGAGALGRAVSRVLQERGARVRVVTRRGIVDAAGEAEVVAADVTDRAVAVRACAGADVVYHCAGTAYGHWPREAPPVLDGILAAAEASAATLVYGDNLYPYGRAPMPLVETLPHRPVGPNTRTRAELADAVMAAHASGRVRTLIARGSDFYGPFATNSILGERVVRAALAGRPAPVLGNPDLPHAYTFVDDFATAMVTLGAREEAHGQAWHVPSGATRTTREFVRLFFDAAGNPARLTVTPSWVVRGIGLANPTLRAVGEVLYQSEAPWIVDAGKFVRAFGDIATVHEDAVERTVAWFRGRSSPGGRAASSRG